MIQARCRCGGATSGIGAAIAARSRGLAYPGAGRFTAMLDRALKVLAASNGEYCTRVAIVKIAV